MTDEERKQEGADEEIGDLEAPAEAQTMVAGGKCPRKTLVHCQDPTQLCMAPTCRVTEVRLMG